MIELSRIYENARHKIGFRTRELFDKSVQSQEMLPLVYYRRYV